MKRLCTERKKKAKKNKKTLLMFLVSMTTISCQPPLYDRHCPSAIYYLSDFLYGYETSE